MINNESIPIREILFVLAATSLATALRLPFLDAAFVGDEFNTVMYAAERAKKPNMPAYYILTLFSQNLLGPSETAARMPSVLLGIAAVPAMWFAWRSIVGQTAVGYAVVLLATCPWHIAQSQTARFYTGLFLFSLLAFAFFYRAIQQDSFRWLAAAILSALAAFAFHKLGFIVFLCWGSYCIWILIRPQVSGHGRSRVAKSLVIAGLVVAPLILVWQWNSITFWKQTNIGSSRGSLLLPVAVAKFFGPVASLAALIGAIVGWLTRKEAIYLLFGIVLPGIILMFLASIMPVRPRYFMVSLPLVLLVIGILAEAIRIPSARMPQMAGGVVICGLVIASWMPDLATHYSLRRTADVRKAVAFVNDRYQSGDMLISTDAGVPWYAGDKLTPDYGGDAYDNSVGWYESLDEKRLATQGTMWIVLRTAAAEPADRLEQWLRDHARLVWRQNGRSFGYDRRGFEVYTAHAPQTP